MSRYPSNRAVKVQALWDMAHACKITGCELPDDIGIPGDVWVELMQTEGIHKPHWEKRIRNDRAETYDSLDDYYVFFQDHHSHWMEGDEDTVQKR
jgi:hypothetical protein